MSSRSLGGGETLVRGRKAVGEKKNNRSKGEREDVDRRHQVKDEENTGAASELPRKSELPKQSLKKGKKERQVWKGRNTGVSSFQRREKLN